MAKKKLPEHIQKLVDKKWIITNETTYSFTLEKKRRFNLFWFLFFGMIPYTIYYFIRPIKRKVVNK